MLRSFDALEDSETGRLVKTSYDMVRAKPPKKVKAATR
jgi:hypothetical protein